MKEQNLLTIARIGTSIHNVNKVFEKEMGFSLVQWVVLKRLVDMPATSATSLAKSIGIHASSLTPTLRRLQGKKMVAVMIDPHDSRKRMVSLTKVGYDALLKVEKHIAKWNLQLPKIETELAVVDDHLRAQLHAADFVDNNS